ncbi:Nucleoprotein TPR [Toxocara canis]|uniref:Nucleoprotein TPR n=2 Tax=Toxocara canis TaxID=6265 RepID=A0A0B2VE52_TOXCA|nr:Nucleoprotein TPR [Toxocara canis]
MINTETAASAEANLAPASASALETAASCSATSIPLHHGSTTPATNVLSSEVEELKREKVQIAQELFVLSEQHSALQTKCCKLSETVEAQTAELESMIKDRRQRMSVMRELEAERDRLMMAKNECEQKAEMVSRQKQDYESRVERLMHDKCLLAADVQSLKEELEKSTAKNCLLQTKIDEVGKDKRMFEFEKECWAQEKEIYLRNREWFTNEIKDRDTKLTLLRIESARIVGELEAQKATLSDEVDAAKENLNKAQLQNSAKDEQIAKLNERIKEVLDDRAARVNKMEEELLAAERVMSVYKEASEDAEKHLSQLRIDYDEQGKLLEESKEAYEAIRSQMESQEEAQEQEIRIREQKINDLNDELAKANDLLKSKHRLSLTDDEISALSPSAAAACSLIRSGVSLTGIYREHCRVVAELEETKNENMRLEEHFRELVEEIEQKAPILAQQRMEHERISELCAKLQNQLQTADEERQRLVSARDAASRELAYTKAELERYQRDSEDMARQIRHLLHAYEVSKVSMSRDTDSPPMSEEDRDVLWSSIGELQRVNQKLMSELRAAQANNQKAIDDANNTEIKRLAQDLDEATKRLDTMKDYSNKQDIVIEKLKEQRDSYKRVADERKTEEESTVISRELSDARVLIAQLKVQAERAEKMLDIYREEKQQAEKILQDRIDQQITLICGLRKTNGKLEADFELQKQTQELLKKQAEADEQQLNNLQEKNAKLSADLKVLNERLLKAQEELMNSKGELAKYKTEVNVLRDEVTLLRSTNSRITQELQVVRESSYNNEKMALAIQHMQSRLDHSDSEKLKRMEDQLTIARNENENLKKFVSEITEQHRIISLDLKMTSNKVITERDQALSSKKSAEDRLSWKENELAQLQTKYDQLIQQINAPDSVVDTTVEGYKKDAQQLRNKNNYLENQLKDLTAKLEAAEKKLGIREKELENFTKVSGNLENTLMEQSASNAAERRSLQSMLDLANQQLDASTATIAQLRGEIFKLEQRLSEESMKCEQLKVSAQKDISEVEKKLNSVEALRVNAESSVSQLNTQIAELMALTKTQEEGQQKLKEHVSKLEDEIRNAQNKLLIAENSRTQCEVQLEEAHKASTTEIAKLRLDKKKLEDELQEAQELSKQQTQKVEVLNSQLMKLSERVAFLEKTTDPELGTSSGMEASSANALYDVIKYLQMEHEKEAERTMNAELQWKRLQAQQAAVEERSAKLQEEVNLLRSKAEESMRAITEKSEMVSRLALLQGVQKENVDLKGQLQKHSLANDQLTKTMNELKHRVATLEAEKVGEKSKLQNAMTDVQNARKEAESWKGRHAQAMSALGKCGPERVLNLTSEVENLKRKLQAMTNERDTAKQEVTKLAESADASASSSGTIESLKSQLQETTKQRNDMHGKFEQARTLARQYRMKYQNLEKEHAELKEQLAAKETAAPAAAADESNKEEINRLTQQLQTAQNELEQYKQKIMATRTGWPVEQPSTSTAAQNKAAALLQTQIKQVEGLNQQNKELTKKLEELTNLLKESQTKLNESEARVQKLQAESDSKEELHFRLNSITSMANKRETELAKLRDELEVKKGELEESDNKVKTLELELKQCRTQLSEQENASRPSAVTAATTTAPTDATTKPVSPAKPLLQTGGLQTSATRMFGSTLAATIVDHAAGSSLATSASASTGVPSAPVGASATTQFTFPTPSRSETSMLVAGKTSPFVATSKTESVVQKSGTSVSTTSEQSSTVASSSEMKSRALGTSSSSQPLAASLPARTAFGSLGTFQFGSSSTAFKSTFGGTTSAVATPAAANQSNMVSQSSATPSAISTSVGTGQQNKPAQQNVISGSGDGTNVISSSGTAHSASALVVPPTSSMALGSASARKRPTPQSDQSSSVETGSEVQDPVKRQRASPTEQVSTSGRFVQSTSEPMRADDKLVGADDDEAEQEQQESVETTTNPEDEGVGEDFLAEDADAAEHVASEGGELVDDNGVEQHGNEEDLQDMEGEPGDEELLIDEEQGGDLDETLGEGGEEEYEEEMEEEDEDYDDEEDDDFDEEDEEEISDSQQQQQRFGARIHARNIAIPPMRAVTHRRNVDEENDDDIILIEDDDEEDEGGGVEYSHSPADQSMDEADEGIGRVRRVEDDADTSLDEPNRAERENDDHDGRRVQSHGTSEVRDTNDHLELQQAPGSQLDSSSSQSQSTTQIEAHSDESANRVEGTNSEAADLHSGEMELSQSLDTAHHVAQAGDVVSGSGLQASRDSSPFVVNIESDSRGASSTVAPMVTGDMGNERGEAGTGGLMREHEEDDDGRNEVAEEEHAEKRAPQTDDEGTSEPSTSDSLPHRRIRIRYPDIDEPSSSSNDGPQATRGQPTMRGARGTARGRMPRGRYF